MDLTLSLLKPWEGLSDISLLVRLLFIHSLATPKPEEGDGIYVESGDELTKRKSLLPAPSNSFAFGFHRAGACLRGLGLDAKSSKMVTSTGDAGDMWETRMWECEQEDDV